MTRKINIVLEAISPICHFDTRTGINNGTNIRLAMTQPLMLNNRRVYAPHISENALRTTLLRIPLGDHLISTLGLAGQVPRAVLNLLYSGGAMGKAKKTTEDGKEEKDSKLRVPGDENVIGHGVGKLYPSLALLGGAVDAMILPRSKLRLNAWLMAQEYATAIDAVAPELANQARAVSAWDLLGDETRTRGTGDEAQGNQMLYSYQAFATGTKLLVQCVIDRWAAPVVDAALARGLVEWDGYIGGQGRQGRGRMRIVSSDGLASADIYDAHVREQGAAMRDGILSGTLGAAKPICLG